MTLKHRLLAAALLSAASEDYETHGCNVWEFPDDWTEEERVDFVKGYCTFNSEQFEPSFTRLYDFEVMRYLADLLSKEE